MAIATSTIISQWGPNWSTLGEDHTDFLDFLRASKLLYCMRGFEHSSELEEASEAIQKDGDGHPMIRVEGTWIRWETIKAFGLQYDEHSRLLRDHRGNEWNYIPSLGLTERKRYNNIYPICRLSQAAMNALDASVTKTADEIENRNYFQLITDGRSAASRTNHVAIRLIARNGDVYSLGFETIRPLAITLKSQNVHISSLDFREFKSFDERPTTTIALSDEKFDAVLARVTALTQTPIRFNVMGSSCVSLASDLMNTAGIEIDVGQYPLAMGYGLLPKLENVPCLGPLVSMVKNCAYSIFLMIYTCTPSCLITLGHWTFDIVTYIPCKILTILRNFLMIGLGSYGEVEPATQPVKDDEIYVNKVGNFTSRITSLWQIFSDEVGLIASPLKLIDWQDGEMKSHTYTHKYDGSPKLYIVPPRPDYQVLQGDAG